MIPGLSNSIQSKSMFEHWKVRELNIFFPIRYNGKRNNWIWAPKIILINSFFHNFNKYYNDFFNSKMGLTFFLLVLLLVLLISCGFMFTVFSANKASKKENGDECFNTLFKLCGWEWNLYGRITSLCPGQGVIPSWHLQLFFKSDFKFDYQAKLWTLERFFCKTLPFE